ncbi:MAG: adenylyl-sulfate reductase subunit alpha [Acidobacteriota bacterium]
MVNHKLDAIIDEIKLVNISTDILVIGGGTAGCFAAITIKETSPETDVLVIEKGHVDRSGCLAAGVNAINAYLNPGETPASYLKYVRDDSAGLVREDLVYSVGERLNRVTEKLASWGLPFIRDEAGNLKARGKRSVEIVGEAIKPVIAAALKKSGAQIMNRVVATNFIVNEGQVSGVYAINAREKKFYVISAKAVICATGGAAGIYKPNNDGSARHKMWYCPFNVGTGLAMGLRAGAEMTTFEMRFIALRIKDVIAPTGTVAQGVNARQINAQGEEYQKNYENDSTPMRMYATIEENKADRGPCYLDLTHLSADYNLRLKEAYLSMAPGMVLKWANSGLEPNESPVEICGSEPYVVGGHGQAGYWVDVNRQATIGGLFAAGDVAGGAPKKYVSGCFAEGEISALAALDYIRGRQQPEINDADSQTELDRVFSPLNRDSGVTPDEFEERLQKIMDEYAGGISTNYELSEPKLLMARKLLATLEEDVTSRLAAGNIHDLVKAHEVIDRVLVASVLVEHLLYRKETRWRSYQERIDYPYRDDGRWMTFVNSLYDHNTNTIQIVERAWTGWEESL